MEEIGVLAGVGVVLKLFPSVLALWPTGDARLRSIGLAIAVFVGLVVVSLPIVGIESWLEFASAISNAQPACTDARFSIPCALGPVIGVSAARMAAIAVGGALVLLALLVRNDRAAFVLFGAAMLAPVADMHPHYWLFAYVALAVLIGGMLASFHRPGRVDSHYAPSRPDG